jgi:hypothetical protein
MPDMYSYDSFLLLLVVLSAYFESPPHVTPPDSPDSTIVTVCPENSSNPLGVLTPVLPQNEVYMSMLPKGQALGKLVKSSIPTPHENCGCAVLGNFLCVTNCEVYYQSLA